MTERMTRGERWAWLLWRINNAGPAHVRDETLVSAYDARTSAPARALGDDLRDMHAQGLLERERLPLSGESAKWVYAYSMSDAGRAAFAKAVEEADG